MSRMFNFAYVTQAQIDACKRQAMFGAAPSPQCLQLHQLEEKKRIHDLELAKLQAQVPRKGQPSGNPPFGLDLGAFFKNLNNSDKSPKMLNTNPIFGPHQRCLTPEQIKKYAMRGAPPPYPVCRPTPVPTPIPKKCQTGQRWNWCVKGCVPAASLMPDCPPPTTNDKDKALNQGRLVSQVTPGKLRKEPDILASLLQAIFDFFKNLGHPAPKPIQNVMKQYPAPPYASSGAKIPPLPSNA